MYQNNTVRDYAIDPVTGLVNYDGIQSLLFSEVNRIKNRQTFGGTALLIEVDNYYDLCEKYGKYVTSLCLRQVADSLSNSLLSSSQSTYLGEGEFVTLFPDMPHDTLINYAEALRSKVDRISFKWHGIDIRVKCSVALREYKTAECFQKIFYS